jgi:hypothetical protein
VVPDPDLTLRSVYPIFRRYPEASIYKIQKRRPTKRHPQEGAVVGQI